MTKRQPGRTPAPAPPPAGPVPVRSTASPVAVAAQAAAKELTARADAAFDDRHFTHLGKQYFQAMFAACRGASHWPVRYIWLGVKGAAYSERARGRKVNPSWMVETTDGRCWTNRGAAPYDTKNMRRWEFGEVYRYAVR